MSKIKKTLYRLLLVTTFNTHFIKAIEAGIILKLLDLKSGERVCDIACGSGQLSAKMVKQGCSICGIDLNSKAINYARLINEGRDCSFFLDNAEMLPFEDRTFDKVVSACALEHFQNDDAAIKEMYRVLKNDGALVLTVDSFTYRGIEAAVQRLHRKAAHVVRYYTMAQLAEKLVGAGFQIEETNYFFNSPVSAFIFKQKLKYQGSATGLIFYLLFPLVYCLCSLSDRFRGRKDEGYLLAMKAVKR